MKKTGGLSVLLAILLVGLSAPVQGERLGYEPSEFIARRQALAARVGNGTVLLFGSTMPALAARFHQDHDFYYLTGNEDLNAVLVMDVSTIQATLFLPEQGAREIRPYPLPRGCSSPPRLTATSWKRTASRMRLATTRSTRSPAE